MLVEQILAHLPNKRPLVLLICGLPGSGKTWLARQLLPQLGKKTGTRYLQTDRIRHELFPVRRYTRQESEAVYRELLQRAERAVRAGQNVILDGTYLVTARRAEVYRRFRALGVPVVVLLATAPEEIIKRRFARRARSKNRNDYSEATYEVYLEMKHKLEHDEDYSWPSADEHVPVLVVDTEQQKIETSRTPSGRPGDRATSGGTAGAAQDGHAELCALFASHALEAVIFDMDGVMIRSEHVWIRSEREFLESRGIYLGEAGWRDFQLRHAPYLAGRNQTEAARFYKQIFELPESIEEIRHARMAIIRRYFTEVDLVPGFYGVLQVLHAGGLKIGLASGSPLELIELILRRYKLESYFSAVISGDETSEGKPNPTIYLLAARELGVEPRKCLVFEDAPNGVKAAKAAGMYCVYLPNPALPWADRVPADFVLKSFHELDLQELKNRLNSKYR